MLHTVLHEVYHGGAWHDVTAEVHEESSTTTRRGLDQFGEIKPATLSWVFEDPTEKWVPGNPMSPLYGAAGRAMPCRLTVGGSVRAVAEAAVFAPDRTEGFTAGPPQRGRQWVEMRADGLLARIGSWREPLRSPMYRALSLQPNLIGHFPLEEGRDAEQLSNTVAGGAPGFAKNMVFGDADAPAGAASAAQFDNADNTSRIDFTFTPASSTAGWQFAWSSKLAALPSSITYLQMISVRASNGYRWTIDVNQDSYRFRVTAGDGTLLEDSTVLHSPSFGQPNQWITYRMKATASGGTVTAEFAWYVQGDTTPWGSSGTFSGTLGYLVNGSMNGNAWMADALVSHVYAVTGGTDDLLSYATRRAFDGYVGELAGDRFTRLLDESGVDWTMVGDPEDTLAMGRQQPGTLIGHLQEIAATDRCLIYDSRTANAIEMRTRADLYRQTPVAFLWPDDIAPPFNERYDYIGVANRITATQVDGGEATAALESGPMSIQPAPDGIGERKGDVDVNVADEGDLALIAGWELAQGTVPGARFPEITFDLDSTTTSVGLAGRVTGIEIGDAITIAGFRYDTIQLLVLGIRETIRQHRRKITFTCVPGEVFAQVAEYDDTAARYDSASTTLKNAVSGAYLENFESGVDGWAGTDATVAHSSAQANSGAGSLLMTVTGSPSQAYVRDYGHAVPVTPGTTYRTAMWVRSPQTLSVIAAIDFVDGSFNWVDGAYGSTVVLVANTWTRISVAGVAPVSGAQAIFGPTALTPANGNTLYVDDVVFGAGAAVPDLLTFRTTDQYETWSTTEEPYEVVIEGERMRVTQVGSASLVSGAYDQSAIVVRGLNGVFKALTAGAEIHIATPGRYAL